MFARGWFSVNSGVKTETPPRKACAAALHANDLLRVRVVGRNLWGNPHAWHLRDVAMRLAAHIVLETDVVAQIIDEANLEIARVERRIADRDHVLELVGTDLPPPLGGL